MARLPTQFTLSLWLGFLAVTGLSELCGLAGIETLFGSALEAPASAGHGSLFVGALSLGTAGAMALAMIELHSGSAARTLRGELLAFATVGIASSMVLAGALFGPPFAAVFDRIDLALWAVGLSLLALGFDNVVHAPEDEEDEITYRKALLQVEASIPRQDEAKMPRTGADR